jgi:putative AlgH/UPF0301 family transcriptional regulator
MTATLDVLEDIANSRGPRHALLALGYAGWGPGQLEDEIGANGWLTAEAAPELVFRCRDGWQMAGRAAVDRNRSADAVVGGRPRLSRAAVSPARRRGGAGR